MDKLLSYTLIALLTVGLVLALLNVAESDNKVVLDLPEEYSQATSKDTLIAIKQGDTLIIHFNNK